MDKVLDFLHSHFLLLTESLQESCCKLFEKIWTSEMDFRETYVPNMCTYLMTMAVLQGRSFSAYMNRLYVFSPSLLVLEMQFERALNSSISQTGLRIPSKPSFFTQSLWSLSSRTLTERSCCRCRLECEENVLIDYDLSDSFQTS